MGALPLAMVSPLIVTVLPGLMLKMRDVPLVRCTVSRFAPGPVIVRCLSIVSWPLVRLIGLTMPPSNVIVLPGHASMIAWRKLPAPLSPLLVTVIGVAVQAVNDLRDGIARARIVVGPGAVDRGDAVRAGAERRGRELRRAGVARADAQVTAAPRLLAPSLNCTVPFGVVEPCVGVTVAVKVIDSP